MPRKGRKSSRLFSEWVWLLPERYPGHFPASWLSQLQEFWTSSFFNLARKKKLEQTEPPFWWTVSFLTTQLKNELVRNSCNFYPREAGNWSGYLSESSQAHSEKSRLDFLASRGKNYCNLERKKTHLCSQKKKSRIKNSLCRGNNLPDNALSVLQRPFGFPHAWKASNARGYT